MARKVIIVADLSTEAEINETAGFQAIEGLNNERSTPNLALQLIYLTLTFTL